jgi:RimJ/RimL family protein N-acetyltransferase
VLSTLRPRSAADALYKARMQLQSDWPGAESIETPRLTLEPLRVEHADEMSLVLRDQAVYTYIGGGPPSVEELRSRYERQLENQSPDSSRGWLNWIVREREAHLAVGAVQATLCVATGRLSAELAWVIGVAHQGRGYATEAARAMVSWLRRLGVNEFTAHIHPGHGASESVAARIGLIATDGMLDGERRWASRDCP